MIIVTKSRLVTLATKNHSPQQPIGVSHPQILLSMKANQGAIDAPCTAKREMEFQKCLDEEER